MLICNQNHCLAINNGLLFEAARAITPELIEELDDHGPDLVEDPSSRPDHEAQGRQKSVAALKPFDPYAVLARLSGPMTTTNSAFISDLRSHYDVPEGQKFGGLLYLCNEKIHSILHSASEIMCWGSLINCSGEAAETAHKINVKGPGSNVNQRDSALGTLMKHARRKETARLMGSAIQGKNMS